jgi:hypothetical protein
VSKVDAVLDDHGASAAGSSRRALDGSRDLTASGDRRRLRRWFVGVYFDLRGGDPRGGIGAGRRQRGCRGHAERDARNEHAYGAQHAREGPQAACHAPSLGTKRVMRKGGGPRVDEFAVRSVAGRNTERTFGQPY